MLITSANTKGILMYMEVGKMWNAVFVCATPVNRITTFPKDYSMPILNIASRS